MRRCRGPSRSTAATMSWSSLTSGDTYKSPAFIALVSALCVAVLLLLHHCVLVACCHHGSDRRRRWQQHHHRRRVVGVVSTSTADARRQRQPEEEEEASVSVEVSATSRTHLVAAAVVCRYRKEEAWNESTCPVCLADFDDGEAVRVLPECMHYFHAECIDTWLRGSTSCPMCRADTTPSPASVRHHLELSVSLEEILVAT